MISADPSFLPSFLPPFSQGDRDRGHTWSAASANEESLSRSLGSLFDVFEVFSRNSSRAVKPYGCQRSFASNWPRSLFNGKRGRLSEFTGLWKTWDDILWEFHWSMPTERRCSRLSLSLSSNRINSTSGHRRNASLIRKKRASLAKEIRSSIPSNNVDSSIPINYPSILNLQL